MTSPDGKNWKNQFSMERSRIGPKPRKSKPSISITLGKGMAGHQCNQTIKYGVICMYLIAANQTGVHIAPALIEKLSNASLTKISFFLYHSVPTKLLWMTLTLLLLLPLLLLFVDLNEPFFSNVPISVISSRWMNWRGKETGVFSFLDESREPTPAGNAFLLN